MKKITSYFKVAKSDSAAIDATKVVVVLEEEEKDMAMELATPAELPMKEEGSIDNMTLTAIDHERRTANMDTSIARMEKEEEKFIMDENDDISNANNNENVSDYERLRELRLKRNREILAGLRTPEEAAYDEQEIMGVNSSNTGVNKKKRKKDFTKLPPPPTRVLPKRSTRNNGNNNHINVENQLNEEVSLSLESNNNQVDEEITYEDSNIIKYSCGGLPDDANTNLQVNNSTKMQNKIIMHDLLNNKGELSDDAYKRIYSLRFHPKFPLLLSSGDKGRVTLYSMESMNRLLSFKAASGWFLLILGVWFCLYY